MVFLVLVQTLQRLFRNICDATTMVSCGGGIAPNQVAPIRPSNMEVSCSFEGSTVVVPGGTDGSNRSTGGFMGAARLVSRPSSKRKLDEIEVVETCALQVRPRREVVPGTIREDQQDGSSAAETSDRQKQELQQQQQQETAEKLEINIAAAAAATNDVNLEDASPRDKGESVFLDCEESIPCSASEGEEDEEEEDDELEVEIDGLSECETNGEASSLSERENSSSGVEDGTDSPNRVEPAAMEVDRLPASTHIQFFVRTYLDGRSIVLQATTSDTIESVHQKIYLKTGLPVLEQRLIFEGRQLQHDQCLEECHVMNDATLNLVGRMRSTALPHSWQLINDLVATIRRMCELSGDQIGRLGTKLSQCQDSVRNGVQEFLKMASKAQSVAEHMQVFQLSGATSALVMLLLSPVEGNRNCGEDAINFFLTGNEDYLPSQFHGYCCPVLLDFCKLLSKSAPEHPLYPQCRSAMARLLDNMDTAHGSMCFNEAKAETIVGDFCPFVNELAGNLMGHLQAFIGNSRPDFPSYIKDAKDFTAFISHFCKAVAVTLPSCEAVSLSCSEDVDTEDAEAGDAMDSLELTLSTGTFMTAAESFRERQIGSTQWLDAIFHSLLEQVDKCMSVVLRVHQSAQDAAARNLLLGFDDRPYSRAPFLFVLKGLHSVAKLSERSSAKFMSVLQRQRIPLNILVRQSRWQDDDFWLLEYKSLLDFESKKRLVMAMLPEPQDDHDERHELMIQRAQLLGDSLEQLAYVEPDGIQGGLSVEFSSEEATGPGVLREWFFMVCKEIFNPQFALFLPCPNDRRRFFPNPASGVNPGHLTYFRFCGRVLALAMMHRVQLDVTFAISFFKQLAGIPVTWEDAKDADPALHASCKRILELDPETVNADVLGLTFVTEMELLVGSRKTLELCPGGKDLAVTSHNRREFVDLLVKHRLLHTVAEQVKCFSQGFQDLLIGSTTHEFLRPLDVEDLDMILYGKDRDISLEEWKLYTEYHDYDSSDEQIVWFWQVVEGMTLERRRKLLFFATSITHLPPEGFAGLSSKFHIHKAYTDVNWLPTAHTCFYQLILPPYPSMDIMHRSLYAITAEHVAEGFGFA